MQIKAFTSGKDMWQALREFLRENPEAKLVFPGDWAREHFLRGEKFFWDSDRLLTFTELWNRASRDIKKPDVLLPQEVGEEISRNLDSFPALLEIARSKEGLFTIEKHLERIETDADLSFVPTSEIEKELQGLRKKMSENQRVSQAAWRSKIARHAKDVQIGDICFLQPPFSNRQFGGLLKGLSRQNNVFLWGLWSDSTLDQWLEEMNIVEDEIKDISFGPKRKEIECLGTEKSSYFESAWYVSDGEISTALKTAKEYIDSGISPRKIAIVVPVVDQVAREIIRLSVDLPLGIRYSIQTQQSPIGSALLMLSRSDYSEESLDKSFLRHWITPEVLEDLSRAKKEGREIEALALFAENSLRLVSGYDSNLSRVWLEGFLETRESFAKKGIEIHDIDQFILSVNSARILYGDPDGIQVVSFAEAANFSFQKTILTSLDESYPSLGQRLILFSKETLLMCPELKARDPWSQFVATLCAADPVFIRPARKMGGDKSEPSSFWRETLRSFEGEETRVRDFISRNKILDLAEKGQASIELKERTIWKKEQEVFQNYTAAYSPTSLEDYLLCPRGWFVSRVLSPEGPKSFARSRGDALHRFLEDAYSRNELNLDLLPSEFRDNITDNILEEIFYSPWPFESHHTEVYLSQEMDLDGDQIEIHGIADRIDVREGIEGPEILLVDYKSSVPHDLSSRLQPLLYTQMAEEAFQARSLGFLFLDLRTGKYSGYLKQKVEGIDYPGISYNWNGYREKALKNVGEALLGIRSGDWGKKGKNCANYCAHRLISETAVIDAFS